MGFRFSHAEFIKFVWKGLLIRFLIVSVIAGFIIHHFINDSLWGLIPAVLFGVAAALFRYNWEVRMRADTAILFTFTPTERFITIGRLVRKNKDNKEVYKDLRKIYNFETLAIGTTEALIQGEEQIVDNTGNVIRSEKSHFVLPFTYQNKQAMIEILARFRADDTPMNL